jgi:hypothetical protein
MMFSAGSIFKIKSILGAARMKRIMLLVMLLTPTMEVFGDGQGTKMAKKAYKPPEVILITTNQPGGEETNQFDCRSKIYVDFFLSNFSVEHHKLEAFWYNPVGKRQEYTRYEFTGNRAYLWLELHSSFGGGLFGRIDPSAGMSDFIGRWEVRLYLDERFLERKGFYVIC